jgi:hypothetical protein
MEEKLKGRKLLRVVGAIYIALGALLVWLPAGSGGDETAVLHGGKDRKKRIRAV